MRSGRSGFKPSASTRQPACSASAKTRTTGRQAPSRMAPPARPAEGWAKDAMPELPFRSIDTGMGLDRTAAVLMGSASVYDTDSFTPIFAKIAEIESGIRFQPMRPPAILSGESAGSGAGEHG